MQATCDADGLGQLAIDVVESLGLTAVIVDDLTLIQGEPCVVIELTGDSAEISALETACHHEALRLVDADEAVEELDDLADDDGGENQT